MKNLTLTYKISIGFILLLLITFILGTMAIVNMKGVEEGSTKLANIYVPEVAVGNNIERYSLLTMYDIRGYSLSEDKKLLDSGRETLKKVKASLAEARELAKKYSLPVLTKLEAKASEHVSEYEALVNKTEEFDDAIDNDRKSMDEAAVKFMSNCNDYLNGQTKKILTEIAEKNSAEELNQRVEKITTINYIINLADDAMMKVFKSQALREPSIIYEAEKNFSKMDAMFEKILKITTKDR